MTAAVSLIAVWLASRLPPHPDKSASETKLTAANLCVGRISVLPVRGFAVAQVAAETLLACREFARIGWDSPELNSYLRAMR